VSRRHDEQSNSNKRMPLTPEESKYLCARMSILQTAATTPGKARKLRFAVTLE